MKYCQPIAAVVVVVVEAFVVEIVGADPVSVYRPWPKQEVVMLVRSTVARRTKHVDDLRAWEEPQVPCALESLEVSRYLEVTCTRDTICCALPGALRNPHPQTLNPEPKPTKPP